LPIIAAMVGNMIMGMVNTIVVGRVSAEALAGVAAGNSMFWPVMTVGMGLMAGLDATISFAFGRKDYRNCDQLFGQGMLIATVTAAIITPIFYWLSDFYPLLGAKQDVVVHAVPYLKAMSLSFPLVIFFNAFQRYWQAQSVATVFTVIMILANIINYFAAVAFVEGAFGFPPLGAVGVGYATLISRAFCLAAIVALSFWLWRRRQQRFGVTFRIKDFMVVRLQDLRTLLRLGVPAAGQVSLEVGAFAITANLVAALGAMMLAAHHIVLTIASFSYMFPLGLASASAVRVGSLIGEGRQQHAREAGWLGIASGGLIMAVFAAIMTLWPEQLIGIFTKDSRVVPLAMILIPLAALFQIFDGIQVMGAGVLRGAGNTKNSFFSNLFGYYIVGMPLGGLLCYRFDQGLGGLWVGLTIGLILTAVWNTFFWWRHVASSLK
jgi:MATE family multidrug resistance protein